KTLLRPGGDVDAPDDERLGVDLAVDLHGVELAEGVRVDVGAGEQRLVQVLPGAGDVVVVGDDVGRRGEAHFEFFRPRPEPAGRGRPGPAGEARAEPLEHGRTRGVNGPRWNR